jgi:hypothetical protein
MNELEITRQELYKERRKIKEFKATLGALHDGQQVLIPRIELLSLQAQLEGMYQLVETLTAGRPAMNIPAAAQNNQLPLHVTRFLEIMPWHPIAQQASVVTEELYEWQVYHSSQEWQSHLSYFPTFFKALPVFQPSKNGNPVDQTSKQGVFTNDKPTQRYDLTHGYFLLNQDATKGPVWKWTAPWKVHLDRPILQLSPELHDTEGWAYAKEAGHFLDPQLELLIHPQTIPTLLPILQESKTNHPILMLRRRKWTRTRVLLNYPLASEATVQFLQLQGNQHILQAQLHKTQRKLHETQTKYQLEQQQWIHKQQILEHQIKDAEQQNKKQQELWQRQKGPSISHFARINRLPVTNGDNPQESSDTTSGRSPQTRDPDHGTIVGALQRLDRIFHMHHISSAKEAAIGNLPEIEPCSDDNNMLERVFCEL